MSLESQSHPRRNSLVYYKEKDRYYRQGQQFHLKNDLFLAVGFFELANAGDFAANVWNTVPVPAYAIALMAVGGTFALSMVYFAYRDAQRSWNNLKGLRTERRHLSQTLKEKEQHCDKSEAIIRTIHALLDTNARETGTEFVDRFMLDTLMGFGMVLVGVGTFLAIDGADHSVWFASNLLSGYIGNAPLALFGLVNLAWSIHVWRRARRHERSYLAMQRTQAGTGNGVDKLLKARVDTVCIHSALNGISCVVAGAASLITATMWWGYIILIPCIITSVIVNYLFRHGMGYDRPLFTGDLPFVDEASLTKELLSVASVRQVLLSSRKTSRKTSSTSLSGVVSDTESMASVLDFMIEHQLFEDFAVRLLNDKEISATFFNGSPSPMTISPDTLSSAPDESIRGRILEKAKVYINEIGPTRLVYRERYLLEILGSYMTTAGAITV